MPVKKNAKANNNDNVINDPKGVRNTHMPKRINRIPRISRRYQFCIALLAEVLLCESIIKGTVSGPKLICPLAGIAADLNEEICYNA